MGTALTKEMRFCRAASISGASQSAIAFTGQMATSQGIVNCALPLRQSTSQGTRIMNMRLDL